MKLDYYMSKKCTFMDSIKINRMKTTFFLVLLTILPVRQIIAQDAAHHGKSEWPVGF